jgi:hypothetical protein
MLLALKNVLLNEQQCDGRENQQCRRILQNSSS